MPPLLPNAHHVIELALCRLPSAYPSHKYVYNFYRARRFYSNVDCTVYPMAGLRQGQLYVFISLQSLALEQEFFLIRR